MRKLRHREIHKLIQGHTADEELGMDLVVLPGPKLLTRSLYLEEIIRYIKLLPRGFISFTSITKWFSLMLCF